MLIVPEKFNRNNRAVQAMGPAADTGLRLIEYMCERIGIDSLAGLDVLDLGCGSRFADAIANRNIQLNSYVGIDVYKEMIDFLNEHIGDPRLRFLHFDAHNPTYNPRGIPLDENTVLPIGKQKFDVICMYSLITHQLPKDASLIFKLLRRHIKGYGHLFFSAALEDGDFGYREQRPDSPTALSVYTFDFMNQLLKAAHWQVLSVANRVAGGLPNQETLVCAPA